MSMLTRALLSILRQKGKTFILLGSIIVIGVSFVTSVFIKSVITQTNEQLYKEMNPMVVLMRGNQPIPIETVEELAKSQDVDYMEYQLTESTSIPNMKTYKAGLKKNVDNKRTETVSETGTTYSYIPDQSDMPDGTSYLRGTNIKELLPVKQGIAKLSDGRTFTKEEMDTGANVVVITKVLADLNGYKVGQKLSGKRVQPNYAELTEANQNSLPPLFSIDTTYEIVGIIDLKDGGEKEANYVQKNATEEERAAQLELVKAGVQNEAYVPNKALYNLKVEVDNQLKKLNLPKEQMQSQQTLADSLYMSPFFMLKNPKDIQHFIEDAQKKLPEGTTFISDYKEVKRAIEKTQLFTFIADIIFIVSVVMTVLVLTLLLMLFMRDRKSEIGLLSALGEKKKKIAIQIIIETFVISLIGISVAVGIGGVVSQQFSKEIAKTQVASLKEEDEKDQNFEPKLGDLAPIKIEKELDSNYLVNNAKYSVQGQDILFIYVISILSVGVASVVPVIYILRLKPKKILL